MEGVTEGRIVHVFFPKVDHPIPALIVRAWGNGGGEHGSVNLTCFPDWGNDGRIAPSAPDGSGQKYLKLSGVSYDAAPDSSGERAGMFWATSVQHKSAFTEEQLAAADFGSVYWDWPARS